MLIYICEQDRGTPFSFTLGKGEVIKGWDQGLVGVCPGQKLNLKIPPALGYGANGAGSDIPGELLVEGIGALIVVQVALPSTSLSHASRSTEDSPSLH